MHLLDLVFYFVGLMILDMIIPDDYKEELGVVLGILVFIGYTICYTALFGFGPYNMIDVIPKIIENITL